jgi:Transmembrane amino acid transporter protein
MTPSWLLQVETKLKSRFSGLKQRERLLRAVWRTIYVLLITIVAASLPFFGDLMGLIGATGVSSTANARTLNSSFLPTSHGVHASEV